MSRVVTINRRITMNTSYEGLVTMYRKGELPSQQRAQQQEMQEQGHQSGPEISTITRTETERRDLGGASARALAVENWLTLNRR